MPASDPTEILLAFDLWATREILDACSELTPAQLDQKFEIGPGSLRATLTHIIGAMRRWTDQLAGRELRDRIELDGQVRGPAELTSLLEEAAADFAAAVRAHPPSGIVSRTLHGKEYSFTRGAVFTHVMTHGVHHRAQCLNMLRHLGVAPLPPSSVTEWTFAVG